MIEAEEASVIEQRLAGLLDVKPDEVRDYFRGNIRAGAGRRTGFRFVRGTHGGRYVRDPEGMDIIPPGWEEPSY
jgi:hypothetical protein